MIDMLEKYLKTIYDKYYNLIKDTEFMCDRDIIEFVYFYQSIKLKIKPSKIWFRNIKIRKKINIDNI